MKQSTRIKPVWIKASEVQALTIWDTHRKMERARMAGNLRLVKREGGIWYNANEIDKIFFKNHHNADKQVAANLGGGSI